MCGCIERDLAALSPFAIAVDRNVVVFSEAAHALLGPSVPMSRRLAGSIEEARDLSIRHQTRQLAHELLRVLRLWPTAPAGGVQSQLDLERGVVTAPPVQNHIDDRVLLAHHDLVERRAQNTLTRSGCGGRM